MFKKLSILLLILVIIEFNFILNIVNYQKTWIQNDNNITILKKEGNIDIADSLRHLDNVNNVEWQIDSEMISYQLSSVYQNNNRFLIKFVSDPKMMDDFILNNRKIVEGEMLTRNYLVENGCMISDELARKNNLKIGSVLTFLKEDNWNISYYFRVIGIYKDYTASDSDINRRNEIITNGQSFYANYVNRYQDQPLKFNMTISFIGNDFDKTYFNDWNNYNGSMIYDHTYVNINKFINTNMMILIILAILLVISSYFSFNDFKDKIIKIKEACHRYHLDNINYLKRQILIKNSLIMIIGMFVSMIMYKHYDSLIIKWFGLRKEIYSHNSIGEILVDNNMYYQGFLNGFDDGYRYLIISFMIIWFVISMIIYLINYHDTDNVDILLDNKYYYLNIIDERLKDKYLDSLKKNKEVFVLDSITDNFNNNDYDHIILHKKLNDNEDKYIHLLHLARQKGFEKIVLYQHDDLYEIAKNMGFKMIILMSNKQYYDKQFDEIYQLKNGHCLFIIEDGEL